VINASSVTIVPTTIMTFRAQLGAHDPTDVFIPILVATFCSTIAGLIATGLFQRLRLWDKVVLAYLGGMTAIVAGLVTYFAHLDQAALEVQSSLLANVLIFGMIMAFIGAGLRRRVDLFDAFVEGGKEGFHTAIGIVPYLVAMLVGIGVFRASGALDIILSGVRHGVSALGGDTQWVEGLPTMLMKPLSGSGARGMMIETMKTSGADSFAGRLACTIQGSSETTFYVLAVYFGSIGIRKTRHAVACGLIADVAGFIGAIGMAYLFWG
jgi:spore maturation protein SpmB